ncbi:MAG: class I tRNA ligase family protein, partial [Patescibacteria group bacterium]
MSFDHSSVEKKWQRKWEEENLSAAADDSPKEKFYVLVEFPYPSGDGLHVGHCRSYTALDAVARKKRMEGKNVLFPIGFDAFGLPTENYAIKNKIQPRVATDKNIANFTKQLKSIGFSFDWNRVIDTTNPKYFKWTQWIFLQFFKKDLAYQAEIPINWCLSCKIGLANEEVVNGKCERCGGEIERRVKKQWMLKITEYADRLLQDLETVDYLPRIKTQQQNWIGRSEGASVQFSVNNVQCAIEVFTTRPDTLFGCTYTVLAPEHELLQKLKPKIENWKEVEKYIQEAAKKSDLERGELNKEKTGVELKGVRAINPVNGEEIPIFVADYVLASYGTGAIMAVPAHDERDFEFA